MPEAAGAGHRRLVATDHLARLYVLPLSASACSALIISALFDRPRRPSSIAIAS
ncbi:hypothetical protein CALCODRAFT_489573 [Calocera cornea HHB12733]|uniref:Uncharacterized protein n=1 Tax=Calocera cornea HHB12733 TaxID=1353952 RepID=A0A165K2T4_9BASI|nr:hypothetical protein CALCODRAFT_489573 [Calocera cornea HHB12733]